MDEFIGTIKQFGFNFIPSGYAHCDGSLLQISAHMALFSLLGTTFGGDGVTTFALPNLTELELPNIKYCIVLEGIYPSRD